MIVECRPYRPIEVGTHREVDGGQYRIYVDGRPVGFIGDHEGASPMIIYRKSQAELDKIESEIRKQLSPQKVGRIKQVSAEPLPSYEEPITYDDFD